MHMKWPTDVLQWDWAFVTITSMRKMIFDILNTTNSLNSNGFEVLHPDALGH